MGVKSGSDNNRRFEDGERRDPRETWELGSRPSMQAKLWCGDVIPSRGNPNEQRRYGVRCRAREGARHEINCRALLAFQFDEANKPSVDSVKIGDNQ